MFWCARKWPFYEYTTLIDVNMCAYICDRMGKSFADEILLGRTGGKEKKIMILIDYLYICPTIFVYGSLFFSTDKFLFWSP